MDLQKILPELLAAAAAAGLEVREVSLTDQVPPAQSGQCRLRGQTVVFLDRASGLEDRVRVLAEALREQDLEDVYLSPAARALIEAGSAAKSDPLRG